VSEEKIKKIKAIIKDAVKSSDADPKAAPPRKSAARAKKTPTMSIVGDGNIQAGGNITQNFYSSSKKAGVVAPPVGTIGANALLRDRIQTLIDELGMRRKERVGDNAFSVMLKNFKLYFKIPKTKKWTCIWLWPESRAEEIIQYFDEKLGNTIKGRQERAASKPGYRQSRRQLFAQERKILDELGLDSDNPILRNCMKLYFGVSSRRDMTDEQLANWVAYLDQESERLYNAKR
jgi:hypothetical protein